MRVLSKISWLANVNHFYKQNISNKHKMIFNYLNLAEMIKYTGLYKQCVNKQWIGLL